MVVAHHARGYFGAEAADWTSFGARGVDIFFVISGFIMAYVTASFDPDQPRAPQVREFLTKRAIRIIPLYWLATAVFSRYLISAGNVDADLLKDFLFIPHFGRDLQDISPRLTPGWTINYEIFFYLVFGLSLFAGRLRYVVLFTTLTGLMAAGMLVDFQSAIGRFYTNPILAEFLTGILLYFIVRDERSAAGPTRCIAAIGTGALVLYLSSGTIDLMLLNGPAAALVLWGALHLFRDSHYRWATLIGDASYSIYLFHVILLPYGKRLLIDMNVVGVTVPNVIAVFSVQLILVTCASLLIYRLVERPVMTVGRRLLLTPKPAR